MNAQTRWTLLGAVLAGLVIAGLGWGVVTPFFLALPHLPTGLHVRTVLVMVCVSGVTQGLLLWRAFRRGAWVAPSAPLWLATAGVLGAVTAAAAGFSAGYCELGPPAGAALPLADLGFGVLLGVAALPVGRVAVRLGGVVPRRAPGGPGGGASQAVEGSSAGASDSRQPVGRLGLRGLTAVVTLALGAGSGAMLIASSQMSLGRTRFHERLATARDVGALTTLRLSDLPRARIPGALRDEPAPAGTVFRLVRRTGEAYPPIEARRAGGRPFAVRLPGGSTCTPRAGARAWPRGTVCLAWPLGFPNEDLALVALVIPLRGQSLAPVAPLVGLLGVLLGFVSLLAWMMGADAARDLEMGARRLTALANPGEGVVAPMPLPRSGDEVGLLLHQLAALKDSLSTDLERVEAVWTRSTAREEERARYMEEVSIAIRAQLTTIRGHVDLILAGASGPLTRGQREDAQILLDSCDQLLRLVQDLLDVSYAEAGQLSLRVEEVALDALLERQVASCRAQADAAGITLRLASPADLPRVRLDPVQVRRVLGNLLSNALKFTAQGEVSVEADTPTPDRVRVSVRDTGAGIAPEHQAVIFEQYRQAPQDRARQQRGSGLGLAIARQIVVLHGGEMGLDSQLGRGSRFWFDLPVRGPGVPDASGAPPGASLEEGEGDPGGEPDGGEGTP